MSRKKHQPGCPCCGAICFCDNMPDTLSGTLTYHNDGGGTSSAGFTLNKRSLTLPDPCLGIWPFYYTTNSFVTLPGYPWPRDFFSVPGYMASVCPLGWDAPESNHLFTLFCSSAHHLKLIHKLSCQNSTPCWGHSGHSAVTVDVACDPLLFTFAGAFGQIGSDLYHADEIPDISAIIAP
jgi:hypothetical protein